MAQWLPRVRNGALIHRPIPAAYRPIRATRSQAELIKRLVSGCHQVTRRVTRIRGRRAHISEPKRLLSRWWRLEINALQREHADLGRRAARRGKTANLTAGRQESVAGNKQRDRIFGHRLTDIARSLWPGAEFLRQSAIGRRVAPSDPPRRRVDLLEERVLLTKVEPEAGKIGLLALEIALHPATADISRLIRCTVPVPAPSTFAVLT